MPRQRATRYQGRRDVLVQRHRDRMRSFLHETTAQIAGYASRRKVTGVHVDDRVVCSRFASFPWFEWREILRAKLDALGVGVVFLSAEDAAAEGASAGVLSDS